MATGTGTAFTTIQSGASVEVLAEGTGRLSVTITNLDTSIVMWLQRGPAAVAEACIPILPNIPFIITSDPNRTGSDNPLIAMSHNVISSSGSGLKLSIEVVNQ